MIILNVLMDFAFLVSLDELFPWKAPLYFQLALPNSFFGFGSRLHDLQDRAKYIGLNVNSNKDCFRLGTAWSLIILYISIYQFWVLLSCHEINSHENI